MRILAIGAHPDDIEIFMFGFLAACKKRGDEVFAIVATDGSKGGNIFNLADIRSEETLKGLSFFGTPILLGLKDGMLGFVKDDYIKIKKAIEKKSPDLIVTHFKNDYHSDHISLCEIVKKIAGHNVPVLHCDTMMGINFLPNYYIDITEFFSLKKNAILQHKSQKPKRFLALAKLMNSYRSAQCNLPEGRFCEAYKFYSSFPFTDITMLLPDPPKVLPFEINFKKGFL